MPQDIKLYKIFLASPSDLPDERASLDGVIEELNQSFQSRNIKLQLKKWETDAYPTIGDSPQDIINYQIGDYDIFIGMMWTRFGQPTKKYGSGTEEEFNLAYKKYQSGKNLIRIMFYFNTKPIPQELLEPDQFQKIRDFKKELGGKGTLYWEYSDLSELERYLRIHLYKTIEDLETNNHTNNSVVPIISEEEKEIGLFDEIIKSEESFNELGITLFKMTEIINEFSAQITTRIEEISEYSKSGKINNISTVKIFDKVVTDMDNFVLRTNAEIPIFKNTLSEGLDAFINALESYRNWQGEEGEDFTSTLKSMIEMKDSMIFSSGHIISFKNSISQLPNFTKSINRSKKNTIKSLHIVIEEMKLAINQIEQFEITVNNI